MYIEAVPNRDSPPAVPLRESCREAGKVETRTLANLSMWPPALVDGLESCRVSGSPCSSIARFSALDSPQRAECIVIAGENGIPAKPDAQPFLCCLCFYVGDDYRFDVCGSHDAGMRPVWLKHQSVRRRWPDVDTDVAVITSLDELPSLCGTA